MSPSDVLLELEKLARHLGLGLRVEPFDLRIIEGKGGLCRVNGRPVVVLDAALPVLDKIAILAEALSMFEIVGVDVPAPVRARIEARIEARVDARLRRARLAPARPAGVDEAGRPRRMHLVRGGLARGGPAGGDRRGTGSEGGEDGSGSEDGQAG